MNFNEVLTTLETNKNSHGIITKAKFNKLFEILPAVDDGNCLFSSIEQLTSNYDLHELRQMVCEYYKNFDKDKTYPNNSPKSYLQIQMISDNEEEDDDGNPQLHENSICIDFNWAGIMDVIALTDILKVNIVLMIMGKQGYTTQPYVYNKRGKTIFVKYNGKNHFEPLLPLFDVKSPSLSSNISLSHSSNNRKRSASRSKSKSKSKTSSASSVSAETKRLIQQMEDKSKSAIDSAQSISSGTRRLIREMEGQTTAKGITKKKHPNKRKSRKRKSRKHK